MTFGLLPTPGHTVELFQMFLGGKSATWHFADSTRPLILLMRLPENRSPLCLFLPEIYCSEIHGVPFIKLKATLAIP